MGLKELKKELASKDKEELISHIIELYKRFKHVKEYFDVYTSFNEDALIEKYKKKIDQGFTPNRNFEFKYHIAK